MSENTVIRVNVVGYAILLAAFAIFVWVAKTSGTDQRTALTFTIGLLVSWSALYAYTWLYAHPDIRKTVANCFRRMFSSTSL
jgi:hypothetical protein